LVDFISGGWLRLHDLKFQEITHTHIHEHSHTYTISNTVRHGKDGIQGKHINLTCTLANEFRVGDL
jgi:hypothetical protein